MTGLVKSGVGPALSLEVGSGPPLKVNSQTKVANLNTDKLDDKNSSEIGRELWAHVNSNGTLVRGNGVQSSGRFSTGYYFVQFNRDVSFCGYVATTTDGYAGPTGTVQGAAYGYPQEVFVVYRRRYQPCGLTVSRGRNLLTLALPGGHGG